MYKWSGLKFEFTLDRVYITREEPFYIQWELRWSSIYSDDFPFQILVVEKK